MVKKILYRNDKEKVIAGVCQGLSEYLDVDVSLIRILAVVFIFFSGMGLIAYIVAWIILPKKEEVIKKKISKKKK